MNKRGNNYLIRYITLFLLALNNCYAYSQTAMINTQARNTKSLNGDWQVIIDPGGGGDWRQVWQEKKPQKKTDFIEYSFDGGPMLKVPGDFNSQRCDLTYVEGTIWYKKQFTYTLKSGKRLFLHFGAVNYLAEVYLNGEKIGSHEGGFTPFQFEITNKVKKGENTVIVKANNNRKGNGLPGYGYDWFNYGGITRSVDLIETDITYVKDYFLQLKKGSLDTVLGWIQLDGTKTVQKLTIHIPELNISYKTKSNKAGLAPVDFAADFKLWSPENPKRYQVIIESETDTVSDSIGFRSIEVAGNKVLLNGKPIFLKAINIHEENPYKGSRAYSVDDAKILLNAAKELGCNLVRLAHYPHNEDMVRTAEKMGILVWSEVPVYWTIDWTNEATYKNAQNQVQENILRDRNRANIIIWSIANETPVIPERLTFLTNLAGYVRSIDNTRLISAAME
ncbi:MAG: glycoside hydrolase family 2, partial [Chloroflexia bacterium]|nr:glycoside hydrolase family 2 [Chloroflexia bacterium]